MTKKKGVLLINLGTPDSPQVSDVRKYLREFLMDGRVIDIPWLNRFILVNGIIAPFRAFSSAKGYQKLWTKKGSPLKFHGYHLKELLQNTLGPSYTVSLGMRYQNPSIKSALNELKRQLITEIIVIPLYPQYASASTGSTIECVMQEIKKWQVVPTIRFISKFFEHPRFMEAFVAIGRNYMDRDGYDHFVFSYHGLPQRQIIKASFEGYCQINDKCCRSYNAKNQYCYRAQCFETSRLLARALNLREDQYTVCFQSRLGKDPWIEPYTDRMINKLAQEGKKNVLCFSPSFVADCLETTIEIGNEYKEQFLHLGGKRWDLVESLNDHPIWIQLLKELVQEEHGSYVPEAIK